MLWDSLGLHILLVSRLTFYCELALRMRTSSMCSVWLLARVPNDIVDALLTFDLAAPVKFTPALYHLGEIVRVVPTATAQHITAVAVSRCFVADAISGSWNSKIRIP